ncbi:hypothetical protein [Nocardia sp. NPDC049707]|uniref:hypothetical protein n=1 Tax=Nocardia sp. NPDC049707 TaxID=3154735 RepID=UPI0034493B27
MEQFTARLDKLGIETWGQAAERAARFEIERATKIAERRNRDNDPDSLDSSSGVRYRNHR